MQKFHFGFLFVTTLSFLKGAYNAVHVNHAHIKYSHCTAYFLCVFSFYSTPSADLNVKLVAHLAQDLIEQCTALLYCQQAIYVWLVCNFHFRVSPILLFLPVLPRTHAVIFPDPVRRMR
jgi:uncharacterized radical SAM superfamily Fe-S cluster-containing enzyme